MPRQSTECVDLDVGLGHQEFLHGLHIILSQQDALLRDVMSQVDNFWLEKQAFWRLELQVKLLEPLEYNVEVLQVLLLHVAKDDNIIQVDNTVREIQLTQGILHETLKSHGGITQPKQHVGYPP